MAQNEDTLWDILRLLDGHHITMPEKLHEPEKRVPLENAYEIKVLKGELVLRHAPQDIEDTIYFMKHRGYLTSFGYKAMWPEAALILTDKAQKVSREQKLPEDEETAFHESLWDISKPKVYGMGFNFGELWRRIKKRQQK